MAVSVLVPTRLRRPHPFVEATRRFYEAVTPDEDGRMRPGPREGVAHLIVTKRALRRALLYLQAIFAESERRGYQIASSQGYESTGVAIVVVGHAYTIELCELHDRVPITPEGLERWRRRKEWELRWNPRLKEPTHASVPNGYLKLKSPNWFGGRSSWSEGPRGPLERKLPSFFEELERRAKEDDVRAEQRRREAELRRLQELEQARQLRLREIEETRVARLASELSARRLAQDARDYAADLRNSATTVDDADKRRVDAWCEWIEAWAERHDPVSNPKSIRGLEADSFPA